MLLKEIANLENRLVKYEIHGATTNYDFFESGEDQNGRKMYCVYLTLEFVPAIHNQNSDISGEILFYDDFTIHSIMTHDIRSQKIVERDDLKIRNLFKTWVEKCKQHQRDFLTGLHDDFE